MARSVGAARYKGSRFTVVLPQAPAGGEVPVAAPGRPAGPLRVMVVDDNADAAAMLSMRIAVGM